MTIVTFDAQDMKRVVDHIIAAPEHRDYWGEAVGPAIWLVADRGVYLMSSGIPADRLEPDKIGLFVAYAHGINPTVDDFDTWYEAKHAISGDDFAMPLAGWATMVKEDIDRGFAKIALKINKKSIRYLGGQN